MRVSSCTQPTFRKRCGFSRTLRSQFTSAGERHETDHRQRGYGDQDATKGEVLAIDRRRATAAPSTSAPTRLASGASRAIALMPAEASTGARSAGGETGPTRRTLRQPPQIFLLIRSLGEPRVIRPTAPGSRRAEQPGARLRHQFSLVRKPDRPVGVKYE